MMSGLAEPCFQTVLPVGDNLAGSGHQQRPGNSSQNADSAHKFSDAAGPSAECLESSTVSDRFHDNVLEGKIASTHARVSESSAGDESFGVQVEEVPAGQDIASAAEISSGVEPTRQPVVNDPVGHVIEYTPQVQEDQPASGLPNVAIDLEAQSRRRSLRTFNNISQALDDIYTTQVGVIRLVGGVIIFAGVAFTLWQSLESDHK